MQYFGGNAVFGFAIGLLLLWLVVASTMQPPAAVRTRLFHLPIMDDAKASLLRQRLSEVQGVREVMIAGAEGIACLKVDMQGFDEIAVEQILPKDEGLLP
jgi:hypothetical protein